MKKYVCGEMVNEIDDCNCGRTFCLLSCVVCLWSASWEIRSLLNLKLGSDCDCEYDLNDADVARLSLSANHEEKTAAWMATHPCRIYGGDGQNDDGQQTLNAIEWVERMTGARESSLIFHEP